jgi:hypothetical protein
VSQRLFVLTLTILLGAVAPVSGTQPGTESTAAASVTSPNGTITLHFTLANGAPRYDVARAGIAVVRPSPLGFRFRTAAPMVDGFVLDDTASREIDEAWEPVWGQTNRIRDHANEITIRLREAKAPHRKMHLIFRAYDDGVAFRYVLPEQPGLRFVAVASEETGFRLTGDHTVWWTPADYDSYEHLYRETALTDIEAVNTPITARTSEGLYLSFHEANLTNYAGMTLARSDADPFTLSCALVPWPDGVKVIGSTPLTSPWRTIQIGTSPGDLVESHLILNLNEPCAIEDTSWIRPMKYIGIWWGMHIGKYSWHEGPEHGATTENAKRHIDFASAHGIPGLLIEGWNTGWDRWGQEGAFDYLTPYPDFDLDEVVRYGREKGVALIGHHETGGDAQGYELRVDDAFALCREKGIPAVKTGYAGGIVPRGQHHHGQWMVQHYRMIVEKAAANRIMLDVHEPIKPTGISRTYPNMMTREGVRGMEYNAWSEGNPPEHTTILPFTRMLAGPLDYTPGIFDLTFNEYKPGNRVHTTLAKQLALFVVLWSPVQMAADLPENYEGHDAFAFIEQVPTSWDETKVLDARIGDYVVMARRSGSDWFVGCITDEEPRMLELPLTFLDPGKQYDAHVYADAADADWRANPTAMELAVARVASSETLPVRLAPGGGLALRFTPVGE